MAEIGVKCFTPEPVTLSEGSLIGLDLCHVLQPATNHCPTGQKPSEGDRPFSPKSGLFVEEGEHMLCGQTAASMYCCFLCCPATFDSVLVRQTRGRFAARVGTQEVLIFSFRAGFWVDLHLGGWLCHHLLLSAQGFQPLEMAAVDRSLPWLHPQGLVSDSCSWSPCWWINLAGGASFTHLLPGATCILAP